MEEEKNLRKEKSDAQWTNSRKGKVLEANVGYVSRTPCNKSPSKKKNKNQKQNINRTHKHEIDPHAAPQLQLMHQAINNHTGYTQVREMGEVTPAK